MRYASSLQSQGFCQGNRQRLNPSGLQYPTHIHFSIMLRAVDWPWLCSRLWVDSGSVSQIFLFWDSEHRISPLCSMQPCRQERKRQALSQAMQSPFNLLWPSLPRLPPPSDSLCTCLAPRPSNPHHSLSIFAEAYLLEDSPCECLLNSGPGGRRMFLLPCVASCTLVWYPMLLWKKF